MEVSPSYQNNIRLMQKLGTNSSRANMQQPYEQSFEAIYQKAQESDVTLSTAKSFLKGLSSDELSTLQHYTGLAESVNVDTLSNEGAYNLLMHDAEMYDFNHDGIVQDGVANKASVIPTNMSDSMKEAYASALSSMDEKQRFDAMTLVSLGNATTALSTVDGRLSNSATQTPLTYELLSSRINTILHPTGGAYTSPEVKASLEAFWENFQKNYQA